MDIEEDSDSGYCKSCGEILVGKYCYKCGEKKLSDEDHTVRKFFDHAVDIFIHYDSKILKSIYLLVTKPGFLVSEYLNGRRVNYAKPIQLFFLINVVYFVFLNYIGFDTVTNPLKEHMSNPVYGTFATSLVNKIITQGNLSLTEYESKFYDMMYIQSKIFIVLLIPLFALVFKFIYLRMKVLYYDHLVFSTFFFCYVLFFYTFFLNIIVFSIYYFTINNFNVVLEIDNEGADIFVLIVFFIYLFYSLKRVYNDSNIKTLLNSIYSVTGLILIVIIYNFILFLSVYLTV